VAARAGQHRRTPYSDQVFLRGQRHICLSGFPGTAAWSVGNSLGSDIWLYGNWFSTVKVAYCSKVAQCWQCSCGWSFSRKRVEVCARKRRLVQIQALFFHVSLSGAGTRRALLCGSFDRLAARFEFGPFVSASSVPRQAKSLPGWA